MMDFEEWRSCVLSHCGNYVSFPRRDVRGAASDFRLRRKFGIDMAEMSCRIDRIERSRAGIRRDDSEYFFLLVQHLGTTQVSHEGRDAILHPGDCLILDSTRPAELRYDGAAAFTSVHLPRAICVEGRASGPATGRRVAAAHPLQASLLNLLSDGADADEMPDGYLLDFVALMFRADPAARGNASFRDRFGRFAYICRTVEAHLAEPELSIDRLAGLVAMSRRQLQRDFADNGTSFTQFLAERRVRLSANHLRRAALMAVRPAISEIAWRCGFRDLSTFNRTFRSHFGTSPRDYHAGFAAGAVEH